MRSLPPGGRPNLEFGSYHEISTYGLGLKQSILDGVWEDYHPSYSSIRGMFFTKIEPTSILFQRLLTKETLLSHLMNSTD